MMKINQGIIKYRCLIVIFLLQVSVYGKEYHVKSVAGLTSVVTKLAPGIYKDLKLIIENSGSKNVPIEIKAEKLGESIISGDAYIQVKGDYVHLSGLYFKDGQRNDDSKWKTQNLTVTPTKKFSPGKTSFLFAPCPR